MPHDSAIRWTLVLVIGLFATVAMKYRIRSATSEKLDRWQEGVFILFGLRLSAFPVFLAGCAWLIDPRWMAWSSFAAPVWLRWLGVALTVGTGALVVWTFHNLGKNLTDTVVTRKEHSLVTSGPYRYVRHPFYVAFALGLVGGTLAMANWFFPLAGAVPFAFLVARMRIEERKLVERFGADYEDYMRRVGRFVPRWKA